METVSNLAATSGQRRFRIMRSKSGAFYLQRQNRFDGTWKLSAREGSTSWNVTMDMVKRGYVTLVEVEGARR